MKAKRDTSTIIVTDVNTSLLGMNRKTRQKIDEEIKM